MSEHAAKGIVEPYVEGVWHFKSPYWRKHLPEGLQFRFGMGTVAVASLIATLAGLGILDHLGVVDSKRLWESMVAAIPSLPEFGSEEDKDAVRTSAADWLNALVPITALDNLLRGKKD